MKEKINHPYHVSDDFFENLKEELMLIIQTEPEKHKKKSIILTISKYAAIILLSFILGRLSGSFLGNRNSSTDARDSLNPELVLSQVSEDEITNYFIENVTEDIFQ